MTETTVAQDPNSVVMYTHTTVEVNRSNYPTASDEVSLKLHINDTDSGEQHKITHNTDIEVV